MKIKNILSRSVLDSRGNPTIEVDVQLADDSIGRAIVPSGASTGALATIILKNTDSNKEAGQDRLMQDAALTNLNLRMEAGTSGGRLISIEFSNS